MKLRWRTARCVSRETFEQDRASSQAGSGSRQTFMPLQSTK